MTCKVCQRLLDGLNLELDAPRLDVVDTGDMWRRHTLKRVRDFIVQLMSEEKESGDV